MIDELGSVEPLDCDGGKAEMPVPTFILRIVPSTAAFGVDESDHREEYARILIRAAADLRAGWEPFDEAQPVLDSHGRRVGTFRVELG